MLTLGARGQGYTRHTHAFTGVRSEAQSIVAYWDSKIGVYMLLTNNYCIIRARNNFYLPATLMYYII